MYCVSLSYFHSGLGWEKHIKVWHAIFDCSIRSSIFMKQHSRYCIKSWRRGDHKLSLNHLELNTRNIFIMLWVEYLQDMLHFIIINLFDWSGVWIWNRLRVRFNWKLWRVNLNITIINGIIIKSHTDIWNRSTGFGRIGTGFEVRFLSFAVPLSCWLIYFVTMKLV